MGTQGSYNGPQQGSTPKTPTGRTVIEKIMAGRKPTGGGQHRR